MDLARCKSALRELEGVLSSTAESEEQFRGKMAGCVIREANLGEGETEVEPEKQGEAKPLLESSDSEERAVGGASKSKSIGEPATPGEREQEEKREKVPKLIVLQGEVTFIKLRASKFVGLKERKVELGINRVKLAQKKREVRYGKGVGNKSCTSFAVEEKEVKAEKPAVDEQLPGKRRRKRGKKSKARNSETSEKEKSEEAEEPIDASEECDNRLYLEVEIEGKKYQALFDPGATCSLIGPGLSRHFSLT